MTRSSAVRSHASDPLSRRVRALCTFAAHMACGDEVTAAAALMVAREARMPRREAEECALMLVLHADLLDAAAEWEGNVVLRVVVTNGDS